MLRNDEILFYYMIIILSMGDDITNELMYYLIMWLYV